MNERYLRHQLIPGWQQDKLETARVVIIGMGALGNEVSRILAMSGVRELILCDPDIVETSNLSRTLLFRESDVGQLKVDAAARALRDLTPGVDVTIRPFPFVHGVGLAELRDAGVVLSCLDSRAGRLQLAGRCQLVRAACIDGGTHPWGGELRPYLKKDPEAPCYCCSLTPADRAIADIPMHCMDINDKAEAGAAAPSSAMIGTWMAMVATRYLMGFEFPPDILKIDGGSGLISPIKQKRDPECPFHRPIGKTEQLAVSNRDTLNRFRSYLPEESSPLLWEPVQYQAECTACGYSSMYWQLPRIEPCPDCGKELRPRTTPDLSDAPGEMTLAELGIPPNEIIPVRTKNGFRWIEIS